MSEQKEPKYITQQTFNIVLSIAIMMIGGMFVMYLQTMRYYALISENNIALAGKIDVVKNDVDWIKRSLQQKGISTNTINYNKSITVETMP